MMMGGLAVAPPLTPAEIKHSTCTVGEPADTHPVNLTYPVLVVYGFCLIPSALFVFGFNTKYKRLIAEKEAAVDNESISSYHSIDDRELIS